MSDLWLQAEYPIGPFHHPPLDQAVADVLAKAPWAAFSTGDVPFRFQFVDRPEAGTAFLALLNPPTRVPPDGLRYLYGEPGTERRSTSVHTVACPTSLAAPTQNQQLQVELECFTALCGHFPPFTRDQPLPPGSPELRLTRFRKRWRLSNGQHPGLWLFWFGRDDSGGTGAGPAPHAPPGWDATPARQYPLQHPANVPATPLFPFPAPHRMPPGVAGGAPGTAQARAPPPVQPIAPAPALAQPQGYATPQQQQQAALAARQQQLAALASQASLGGLAAGSNVAALEARQQQYLLAQQRQQQAQMPQQQQQQQRAAATPQLRKPAPAPAAQPAPPASASAAAYDETLFTDVLDLLSPRQLAMHRYATQHDLLAPVFDAWTARDVEAGLPRRRDMLEVLGTVGVSRTTGEPRGAVVVPGFGKDGVLAQLANGAARIATRAAMDVPPEKCVLPVEERRRKLEQLLKETEARIERMEQKHDARMGRAAAA
ncbi:hypothetical protein JCM10450v2_005425 [Rhodotorula kratochvilovae]